MAKSFPPAPMEPDQKEVLGTRKSAKVKTNHKPSHNKKKVPPKRHQKGKKQEGKNKSR